ISVAEAVAIHHRDARYAGIAGAAALGDISDPRVEHAGSAGDFFIGQAGAFVRGPAPVAAADDEALAAELAAFLDVIDVAAERHPPVGPGLDEAGNQRLGARRAPFGKSRGGDFRIGIIILP